MAMRRRAPIRNTRQRAAILDYLLNTTSHPTAEEVHRAVRRRIPNVGLATVYRNLEMLVERGMAIRLEGPDGRRHYDGDTRAHYHIACTKCGRVGDIHAEPLAVDLEGLQEATDYLITGLETGFTGLCPRCRPAGVGGRPRGRRRRRRTRD